MLLMYDELRMIRTQNLHADEQKAVCRLTVRCTRPLLGGKHTEDAASEHRSFRAFGLLSRRSRSWHIWEGFASCVCPNLCYRSPPTKGTCGRPDARRDSRRRSQCGRQFGRL